MAQAILRVEGLPAAPLDAAEAFYEAWMPQVRASARARDMIVVFPAAAYDHRSWRLAAIQDLAREAAPRRVNAIVGDEDEAIAATFHWLASAPGITGQLLAVDGKSDENG